MARKDHREESELSFSGIDGAAERAQEMFGLDIEASLRAWFTDMGLSEEYVGELLASKGIESGLGPGRSSHMHSDLALTDRQREALAWAACGYARPEIGERMGISWETVKRHHDNARFTLKATTLAQAVMIAALVGELDPDIVREHLLRSW